MTTTQYNLKFPVGYGYVAIKPGDRLQAGDEFRNRLGVWEPLTKPRVQPSLYRRKIPVGDGFELLPYNAVIPPGAEFFASYEEQWIKSRRVGGLNDRGDVIRVPKFGAKPCEKGYRWLLPEEPLMRGDEFESYVTPGVWVPIKPVAWGRAAVCSNYRRRADYVKPPYPGEGFRLLNIGEQVIQGDHWFDGKAWLPATVAGPVIAGNFFRRASFLPLWNKMADEITKRVLIPSCMSTPIGDLLNAARQADKQSRFVSGVKSVINSARSSQLERFTAQELQDELNRRKTTQPHPDAADAAALMAHACSPRYRTLDKGEILRPDDETSGDHGKSWEPVGVLRCLRWQKVLNPPGTRGVYQFRRRVA